MPATTISIKVSDRLKGGGDVTAVREGSSARRVITAVSDANRNLLLILWQVEPRISRLADSHGQGTFNCTFPVRVISMLTGSPNAPSFTIVTAIRSKLFSNSDILWFLTSLVLPIYPFFYHILKKHIKKQILKEILD
jgi:hypothetical protein